MVRSRKGERLYLLPPVPETDLTAERYPQRTSFRLPYVRERRNDQHSLPVAASRTISAAVATKKDASAPVSRRSCGAVVVSCH